MKKSGLIFLALSFFNVAFASNQTHEFYQEIIGDGLERGFEVHFQVTAIGQKDGSFALPSLNYEIRNNSADCKLDKARKNRVTHSQYYYSNSRGEDFYLVDLVTKIKTRVNADTGGCLVLVENLKRDRIIKIVNYGYRLQF